MINCKVWKPTMTLTGQYLLMGDEVIGASSKPVTAMDSGLLLFILEKRENDAALVCSGDDNGVVVDVWRYSSESKNILPILALKHKCARYLQ